MDSIYSQKTLGTAFTVKRIHWAAYTAKKTLQLRALISTSYQRELNKKFQSTSLY